MPSAVCFGEILWDLLPSGKVAGGAPMNVAFHLNQLGVPADMVSRVGNDPLGREILGFLESKKVPIALVQTDGDHPTGTVQVTLDGEGHASYEIVEGVAWDFIEPEAKALEKVGEAAVFIHGSLAARNGTSAATLDEMIQAARFRVFDINLRPPFYSRENLEKLLPGAGIVKMNEDELEILSEWYGLEGEIEERMEGLKNRFEPGLLLVTRGAKGAVSLQPTGFCWHSGYSVEVEDTVGSGDAFLAGYLRTLLLDQGPENCLDFACRMGALVATRSGGTPFLTPADLGHF